MNKNAIYLLTQKASNIIMVSSFIMNIGSIDWRYIYFKIELQNSTQTNIYCKLKLYKLVKNIVYTYANKMRPKSQITCYQKWNACFYFLWSFLRWSWHPLIFYIIFITAPLFIFCVISVRINEFHSGKVQLIFQTFKVAYFHYSRNKLSSSPKGEMENLKA